MTSLNTLLGASRRGSYCPFAEIMTEGILIICNIAVTARASIGGIALFGAGGCSYRGSVVMSCCGDFLIGCVITS